MNVFINGALSLLKNNGLQNFLSSPLESSDFQSLDSSQNPIAGKMVEFIESYYNEYGRLPTHDFICDQFQIQVPQDFVGEFGFYAKNIIRRKLIVNWGQDLQGVAGIYQTISLDNLNDDEVENKFLQIQQGVQSVIDTRNKLSSSGKLRFMKDIIPNVKEAYRKAKEGVSGVPTPWVSLNEAIMGLQENEVLYIGARPGLGKCLLLDTPILMHNGSIKKVQEVEVGDALMGPDSTPRYVKSLSRGREETYDVVPNKGDTWGCNKSHILSLKCSTDMDKKHRKGQVYNYSVEEFLKLPKRLQSKLKLWRTGIEFPEKELPFNPYLVGVWLAEGDFRGPTFHSGDVEVVNEVERLARESDLSFNKLEGGVNCQKFSLTTEEVVKNPFRDFIKDLTKDGFKCIPKDYKINSREFRLELLAGILDGDGSYKDGCFEITTKYDELAEDIKYLCRSLGFFVSDNEKEVCLEGWDNPRVYRRLIISGELSVIPTRVSRKKADKRKQVKDVLVTGFKLVPRGVDDYYGFDITGDRLFLIGDFTVTHNTMMLLQCLKLYLDMKLKVLVVSTEMTEVALTMRLTSMMSGVPHLRVRKGNLSEGLERAFMATLDRLAENEYVKILGSEFEAETANIESSIIEFEPDIVLVDGIYLVKESSMPKASRVERMPFVTSNLKKWGKRYGHRTIVTSQMNRNVNQSDPETVTMENMSYADSIGQDADFIVGLRATKEMREEKRIEMRSLKTREGEGFKPIDISFDFVNMQFSEIVDGDVVEVSAKRDRRPITKVEVDDIEDEIPF